MKRVCAYTGVTPHLKQTSYCLSKRSQVSLRVPAHASSCQCESVCRFSSSLFNFSHLASENLIFKRPLCASSYSFTVPCCPPPLVDIDCGVKDLCWRGLVEPSGQLTVTETFDAWWFLFWEVRWTQKHPDKLQEENSSSHISLVRSVSLSWFFSLCSHWNITLISSAQCVSDCPPVIALHRHVAAMFSAEFRMFWDTMWGFSDLIVFSIIFYLPSYQCFSTTFTLKTLLQFVLHHFHLFLWL